MRNDEPDNGLADSGGFGPIGRRDFLKYLGAGASTALITSPWRVCAGPFTSADFEKLVPEDKKLAPAWVSALFERGSRSRYRGAELERIGMPVGGICAGQLYLGGDGKLWHWDIFNQHDDTGSSGPHYAKPLQPTSPLEQGFALRIIRGGQSQVRSLDRKGWSDVSFIGEYPLGFVEYRDPGSPVSVALQAYSPFIPLNTEDSALPAVILSYTLKNESGKVVEAELAGWLENAVCVHSAESSAGERRNRFVRGNGYGFLECSAVAAPKASRESKRPDILFDDFEQETYEGWTATGTAFGGGPVEEDRVPAYQGKLGAHGKRAVNSHAGAPGDSVEERDAATGTLTSKPFVLERDFVTFLIGGGSHKGKTCMNLLVDGQAVLSATGHDANLMQPASWDVRRWAGRQAQFEIVDNDKGPWGNIGIDNIVFTDEPGTTPVRLADQADFGTMGLTLLDPEAGGSAEGPSLVRTTVPESDLRESLFSDAALEAAAPAVKPFGQKLIGALGRRLKLAPGTSATLTFVVTWHFANLRIGGLGNHDGRWYGKRFPDALGVAAYVAKNFERLRAQTRLWHETWYDSTLPYWFLDRTFLNTSILATNTCFWLGNGRFYAWEGVGCCAGTCTHVWHYAHAMGRLFPPLERSAREMADYGAAFDPATGRIRFRAEHNNHWAVDGQSGVILRTWREHQMSADDTFLRRVWPRAKKALEFLVSKDAGEDGIIDGPQHNTLDADWFGQIAWLSGLYLAALRAGEEMAKEMGDAPFAKECREIIEKGRRAIDEKLFNGDYFVQLPDPVHLKSVGSYNGCEIDQVFGQSWSWQVGLGRILDEAKTKTALRSLWKYNFTPDVGPYRNAYKPGRWYALAGEGGLLMCTWPRGEAQRVTESFDYYFNECMTGFEYQAAGHMLAEGLLLEGLAVTRMIHDRYHPLRRNPWNEVECGDHYARAMASYGVFLAACGYEHHGPKGHLGFAPRLSPENFRAAFTTAEGWGTFSQQCASPAQPSELRSPKSQAGAAETVAARLRAEIDLRWGRLRLRTLTLQMPESCTFKTVHVHVNGRAVEVTRVVEAKRLTITLAAEAVIEAGQRIEIVAS
ncbi:conserved hypothetical protein [Verrucomicrobia bacterium]|nr:conserved hypothetical protein [Verrucomicrobiota bacterium]